jgi:2-polyprenyl-6-methoxyphenol hydroxylase-like FAD-dependent oxidoreductase
VLEAPQKPENSGDGCVYQICISWNTNNRRDDAVPPVSLNNEERIQTIRKIANDWAEPFHSFVNLITSTTSVKQLDLDDYAPHTALHSGKRVVLIGDAFHAMTMCKLTTTTSA